MVSGFNCTTERGAGGGTSFQPVPPSTALRRCGVRRVPPLAIVEM